MSLIEEFKKIIEVSNALMGENGCLWDHKQTFETLKKYLLEESYEIIDAVDAEDSHNLLEELGDLFYIIIFFCKIAEKEKKFTLEEAIASVNKKLVYRHPHVFGGVKLSSVEEIKEQWTLLKREEKAHRKSKCEGIPKALPALAKAQKIIELMEIEEDVAFEVDEENLGKILFNVAYAAQKKGLQAEFALHREIASREEV